MRKLTATCVAIACLLLLSNNVFSQSDFFESPNFEKGQIDVNIGIGLLPTFYSGSGGLLPLSVSGEYGVTDDISVGGYIGYSQSKESIGTYDFKYTYTIIGVRGAYHVDLHEKLDTYGGVMLGYNNVGYKDNDAFNGFNPTSSYVLWSAFVGTRYKFNEKMSAFGELGYGISYLTVGVSFKL